MKADSFDPAPPKPKVKPAPPPIDGWAEKFSAANTGRWVSLVHPEWGPIEGESIAIRHTGFSGKSRIPEFEVMVEGEKNVDTVLLVETRLQFHDSELEARERWAENYE